MRHKNDIALAATTAVAYEVLITEADQVHNRYIEKLINRPDPIFADPV